jgi:hypothetical protein
MFRSKAATQKVIREGQTGMFTSKSGMEFRVGEEQSG